MTATALPIHQIYSCRAECRGDIDDFLVAARWLITDVSIEPSRLVPDCTLEFRSQARLSRLYELLRGIPDTHVMRETLRPVPLAENSLERDWDVDRAH